MGNATRQTPYLTKSRFKQGITCDRLLWLAWHRKMPYREAEPGSPAAMGTEIGEFAHALFDGGVEVEAPAYAHARGLAETASLLTDPSVWAIFEPALEYQNIRIRVDALEHLGTAPDGSRMWGLREVKASTRLKDEHIADAAIQLYVARGAGLNITSVELVHIDKAFSRETAEVDWQKFFHRADITAECEALQSELTDEIAAQFAVLHSDDEPATEPDRHCPKTCDYWDHCTAAKPEDWIFHIPRIGQDDIESLRDAGIERIGDIPPDFDFSENQHRARRVVANGQPYVSDELSSALAPISQGTVLYLDFETFAAALPLYQETRPYEPIPFQWSLHTRDASGNLTHDEFLSDPSEDPRRTFATSLIAACTATAEAAAAPIVVYSSYEARVIAAAAADFPDLAGHLMAISARLFDLLPIIREHVYLADFKGSYSVKFVGPALAPEFTYDDLASAETPIADGAAASQAFYQLVTGELPQDANPDAILTALRAYCKRDTEAMVVIHRALERLTVQDAATGEPQAIHA